MKYLFYVCLCFILVLIQTTLVRYFEFLRGFYDLFIVLVVFLGLYRNLRESIPIILLAGFLMDNLYNGPFGMYTTTYIWLYVCIGLSSVYFNVRSTLFLFVVVAAGVLFENIMFMASFMIFNPDLLLFENLSDKIFLQLIWALVSGYFFIMLLKQLIIMQDPDCFEKQKKIITISHIRKFE